MKIKLSRWPWQAGYSFKECRNSVFGRFGGGWRFSLGIQAGSTTVNLLCGIGIITIKFRS